MLFYIGPVQILQYNKLKQNFIIFFKKVSSYEKLNK